MVKVLAFEPRSVQTFWITQRAIKTIFDHDDNLSVCPHDVTYVWNTIKTYFKVIWQLSNCIMILIFTKRIP
jgi:hypothetical protein